MDEETHGEYKQVGQDPPATDTKETSDGNAELAPIAPGFDDSELDVEVTPDKTSDAGSGKGKGKCLDKCGCLACILLVVSVAIGVSSVAFDWLWFADMIKAQKGLVFGPPNTGVIIALGVMSALGTISFIMEDGDKIYKYFTGKEKFDEETEELASLFLEEVPEITLNLLLSMCREVPTSYFQLIKAVIAMVSSAFRLLKGICYLTGCREDKKSKKKLRCTGWIILIAACLYTFGAGVAVFIFTYTPPKGDSSGVRFHLPKEITTKLYNTERYFPNAGVFFCHPSFEHCQHDQMVTPFNLDPRLRNWIQIGSIEKFLQLGTGNLTAGYDYDDKFGYFWVKSMNGEYEQCYRTDLQECETRKLVPGECKMTSDDSIKIKLVFIYVKKTKTLVYGDIQFNGSLSSSESECRYISVEDNGQLMDRNKHVGWLQYFKAHSRVNTSSSFVFNGDIGYFYQYHQQLEDVTSAWRTGHRNCPMTGSLRPNPNPQLTEQCAQHITKL